MACVSQNNFSVDTVVAENIAGARRMTEHVLSLDHRFWLATMSNMAFAVGSAANAAARSAGTSMLAWPA